MKNSNITITNPKTKENTITNEITVPEDYYGSPSDGEKP